jgi:uncharacterized protein YggT (Ycf19 family)
VGYVDFILNLAGLLLWLNWCSVRFDPLEKRTPATLLGTLRPASPGKNRRWHLLVYIVALLFLRAVIYRWLGGATGWLGRLDLGVAVLPFRSDWFLRILVFSFLSFVVTLAIFYMALLFLSLLRGPDPIHRLVKIPLGRVDGWPSWAKIILPFIVTVLAWCLLTWLLGWLRISPPFTMTLRVEQSLIMALNLYLVWQFPAGALLVLHLLNSYIYFGPHPFWRYVNATAQTILRPLERLPLRLGRVDFAPLAGMILIFLFSELLENGLNISRLHIHLPGLVGLYGKLPF